jgi:Secretion system C-terminal sorting domain/PKD domain
MKKIIFLFLIILVPVFSFSQTRLTGVSPTIVNKGETLNVTIFGSNTHFTQGTSTSVSFYFKQASGSILVNSITAVNNTTINANITVDALAFTSDYYVVVTDSIDGYLMADSSFHVNGITPPKLVSASPAVAKNGETLDVTIVGASTHFTQGSTTIGFSFKQASPTAINTVTVINDTTIKANITIPAYTITGDYDIYYSNSTDVNIVLNSGFHINGIAAPKLVSVSPAVAKNGETLDVTIVGASTHFTQGSTTSVGFSFKQASGTAVNSITILNDTTIKANITIPPYAVTSNYSVYFNDSIDGYQLLDSIFHINGIAQPSIASVSPNVTKPGETLNVTITGKNTHFKQASSTVYIGYNFNQGSSTLLINSTQIINDTSIVINITVPKNISLGYYPIYIQNDIDDQLQAYLNVFEKCYTYFETNYDVANNTFDLVLNYSTTDSTANYFWDFGDGGTSTLETPSHTFAKDTVYNVCLKTFKYTGDSCTYCHEIGKDALGQVIRGAGFSLQAYKFDLTIGISENTKVTSSIAVYPNPTSGSVTITTQSLETLHNPVVALYSLDGTLLLQQGLKDVKTTLDISAFANGFYILKMLSNETIEVVKIIKE